jgi:hypothetical protein
MPAIQRNGILNNVSQVPAIARPRMMLGGSLFGRALQGIGKNQFHITLKVKIPVHRDHYENNSFGGEMIMIIDDFYLSIEDINVDRSMTLLVIYPIENTG